MDLRAHLQSVLGGAYALDRELTGGAMSRVFVAREIALKRDVVIKVLPPELAGALSADRFQREIELSARLQHPHIVPLLSAGDAAGVPYYTMPLVAGESLGARLERGPLPIRDAVTLLRDIARALAYAHTNGVVHRDIKPDNVLLANDYAVVSDFGIAKAILDARTDGGTPTSSALTQLGMSVGTPAYMSPEQAAGDPAADHRTDVYAFGALAYEVITGATPFAGRSPQAILAAQMTEAPAAISTRRDDIPPALASLVMQCLEREPSDRPQTAEEIVAALAAVTAPASSRPSKSRLTKQLSLAGLAVVVLGAAVATFAPRGTRSAAPSASRSLIAVVPFRVTATDSNVRALREGMLDLITAKLTGATRTIDTRTLLGAWRRAGGSATNDLAIQQTLALAKELGAGRVLEGEVVETNGTLSITGTLIDAATPEKPVTAAVHGGPAAIAALIDTLVAKLLVRSAGRAEREPDALAAIPLPALQAYLEGQEAYRAGKYQQATSAFARALEIDSTFALAGVRMGLAAQWSFNPRAAAGRAIAFRYRDRLSYADSLILGEPIDPNRSRSCADNYAMWERAAQAAPDIPELWYQLAEVLFHCGPAMGVPNAWQRAVAGFQRALSLDSAFSPAREHLPLLYADLGDSAAGRREVAGRDSSDLVVATRYLLTADPKERLDGLREVQRRSLRWLLFSAEISANSGGVYGDYADSLLATAAARVVTSADRAAVASITRSVALERGQPRRAALALRETNAPIGTQILDALFGDGDSTAAESVIPSLRAAVQANSVPDAEQQRWITNAFALAQHEVAVNNLVAATRIADVLKKFVPNADTVRRSKRARDLAMLVDAQVAVLDKRSDARRLTEHADSILRRVEGGEYVGRAGNLIIARLWERLGDTKRAYEATQRLQYNSGLAPYILTYTRERARLAAALGEIDDAIAQYRTYISVRGRHEPALAADVERAKRELARLQAIASRKG